MSIPRRYRTRSATRGHRTQNSHTGIQRYFRDTQHSSPGAIVTAPRVSNKEMNTGGLSGSAMPSTLHGDLPGTPAVFRWDTMEPTQNRSHLDEDLRSLLQALPTRVDIEALIVRIEEAHSRDITEVRADLHTLTDRVASGESSVSSLENRVQALEQTQDAHDIDPGDAVAFRRNGRPQSP